MAKKRARQRGSITPRGNSFLVRVYVATDPVTGQRIDLNGTAHSPGEAEQMRTAFLAKVDARRAPKKKAKLNEIIDRYVEVREAKWDDSTRERYGDLLRLYIRPTFGDLEGNELYAEMLELFYARLQVCKEQCGGKRNGKEGHLCQPLKPSTVRKIHFLIKPILAAGHRWGYLMDNVAAEIEAPSVPPSIPDPPSAKEAAKVLNSAWFLDYDWAVFIWLAMVAGCRRGELIGLRWADVDFSEQIMTVGWSEQQLKGRRRRRKRTKTHQIRRISFDQYTAAILQEQKQRAEELCKTFGVTLRQDAYLFSNEPDHSAPLVPNDVSHRYSRLAKKLEISSTRLHSLRHFTATELVAAGVDLRTVAGRLGHGSGGATTLKVYAAWSPDADARASSVISRRLPRPGAEAERIETVVNGRVLRCLCGNAASWALLRVEGDRVNAVCAPCGSPVTGLAVSELRQAVEIPEEDFQGRPYLRIAAKYRAQIKREVLLPGMQLPSVKKIASEEQVAPTTAHRAIRALAEEGLIVVRRGARAVVA